MDLLQLTLFSLACSCAPHAAEIRNAEYQAHDGNDQVPVSIISVVRKAEPRAYTMPTHAHATGLAPNMPREDTADKSLVLSTRGKASKQQLRHKTPRLCLRPKTDFDYMNSHTGPTSTSTARAAPATKSGFQNPKKRHQMRSNLRHMRRANAART